MRLKKAILSVMGPDTLKAAVEDLDLDGVERRSAEEMAAALSPARRATHEILLKYLYENQVTEVCELLELSATGRRAKLVKRLLQDSSRPPRKTRDGADRKTGRSATRKAGRQSQSKQTTENSAIADDGMVQDTAPTDPPQPVRVP